MKEEHNYPNLATLCRLCLTEDADTVNIFNEKDDLATDKQLSIPIRIMACVALEVQSTDCLPKLICSDCRYQLEKSYYFRKRAQLANSKLRKHIRLLSLGKVSRVFIKDDDDDGEELEFEESLTFIKQQEKIQQDNKTKKMEKLQIDFKSELEQVNKLHAAKLAKELKKRSLMKRDIVLKVKMDLRNEIEAEVREKVREECIESVRNELREQVKDECRKTEMQLLLDDVKLFLEEKCKKKDCVALSSPTISSPEKRPRKVGYPKNRNVINKRNCSPETTTRVLRVRKLAGTAQDKSNENKLEEEEEVHESFQVITKQIPKADDNENREADNFYIVDNDSNYKAEFIEGLEDDNDICSEDDSPETTALYQIEENGDIQTLDKEDENVLYVDMELAEDDQIDMMEFVDLNVQAKNKKTTTTYYASSMKMDVKKRSSYSKTEDEINENDTKTDSEQDDKKGPFTCFNTPKTFKCEICPMVFSTKNVLNRHYRTHKLLEEKGVNYECSECHVIVSCSSALKRHSIIHTGKRPFKCDECGKSFVQREILKRHKTVHTGERPYQCPHCPRAYTQKVNLQQHIDHNHSKIPKIRQHPCHLCPKRFNHASGLSRHLTTHSGVSYQCLECERNFGDRSSVKRHVLTVHMPNANNNELANKFIKEFINHLAVKDTNETTDKKVY